MFIPENHNFEVLDRTMVKKNKPNDEVVNNDRPMGRPASKRSANQSDWIKEHKVKYGVEPNLFDGC